MNEQKTILIVDDKEDVLEVIREQVHQLGHCAIPATNVEQAKEIIKSRSIDLILADINIPNESGITLMRWRKEEHPDEPILLMTGFDDLLHSIEKMNNNKVHVLSKPFTKGQLEKEIQFLISQAKVPAGTEFDDQFATITTREFISAKQISYPIFVRLSKTKYVKVATTGESIDRKRIEQFEQRGIHTLYLTRNDYKKYVEETMKTAAKVMNSDKASEKLKKAFLIHAGQVVVEKIFHEEINEESFNDARKFIDISLDVVTESNEVLTILESINSCNEPLFAHQLAVSIYGVMLAKQMGWDSTKTLQTIALAGLFHDIGKKEIPLEILSKHESEWTSEEEAMIKSHPLKGAELVDDLKQFDQTLVQVILQHHENCIGTGYPFRLKRSHITPVSRLISIIDLFCKYIVRTPYVEPITPSSAIDQLEQFHLKLIDLKMFEALKKMVTGKDTVQ